MFSIDQLLSTPPLSAFFSILLIAGCDFIGTLFLDRLGLVSGGHKDWIRWQAPVVGAMLFAIILYPLALADLTSRLFMQVAAILFIDSNMQLK